MILPMKCLHILTQVKDSIDFTLETHKGNYRLRIFPLPFTYTVYNDFSTEENTRKLEEASRTYGFQLVNLADLTTHPSPNYLLVLQTAQEKAIEARCRNADCGIGCSCQKRHPAEAIRRGIGTETLCHCCRSSGQMNQEKSIILIFMQKEMKGKYMPRKSTAVSAARCSPPNS